MVASLEGKIKGWTAGRGRIPFLRRDEVASTRIPRQLDAVEIRVLGVLLEKEQTTPEVCPLTVNAVLAGANQKTNREPVMSLTEEQVVEALDRLRQEVLAWRTEGARSEKWQQSVVRRWGLDRAGKALMTLLLLRGAQTPGELRTRSERMQPFGSVQEVEEALQRMAGIDEPLVRELPRRPGQKENRWIHLVGEIAEAPEPARPAMAEAPERPAAGALSARVERLEELVARLAADVEELKQLLS
jgi:uncharacterized protein YceH (UPF0502 family)